MTLRLVYLVVLVTAWFIAAVVGHAVRRRRYQRMLAKQAERRRAIDARKES